MRLGGHTARPTPGLAKRQVKAGLAPLKRDTVRLKVDIAYVEATVSLGRLCLSVLR